MSERENMSKEDNFENGVFWELYKDLERQFENFLEYVPYLKGNENVYSFKLLNLILSIGGHVDSAFKEMARYPKFSENDYCKEIIKRLKKSEENIRKGEPPVPISIQLSLRAFEMEYKLSQRKVTFKRLPEREIIPFKPYNLKTNAPQWWELYNGLKHDVGVNIRESNLDNTLNAIAGAFLLNAVHIPSVLTLFKNHVFKIEFPIQILPGGSGAYEQTIATPEWAQKTYEETLKLPTKLETPIFIYDYEGQEREL